LRVNPFIVAVGTSAFLNLLIWERTFDCLEEKTTSLSIGASIPRVSSNDRGG
jgi:hypothetical protein